MHLPARAHAHAHGAHTGACAWTGHLQHVTHACTRNLHGTLRGHGHVHAHVHAHAHVHVHAHVHAHVHVHVTCTGSPDGDFMICVVGRGVPLPALSSCAAAPE